MLNLCRSLHAREWARGHAGRERRVLPARSCSVRLQPQVRTPPRLVPQKGHAGAASLRPAVPSSRASQEAGAGEGSHPSVSAYEFGSVATRSPGE